MNRSTTYTLNVNHNGTDFGDVCIYQTYDNQMDNIRPLVWFNKSAHPGTRLQFDWEICYGLAWGEQSGLPPGAVFRASQIINADPGDVSSNTALLTREHGAFRFGNSDSPTPAGKLGIVCDSTFPPNIVSVGVFMSGRPAAACLASPGLKYIFNPHPRYWIAFGKFEEGQVIDLNRIAPKFEITYPANTYERTVELGPGNTWSLK